ncbi:MAG: hypothetical protein ACJAS4_002083 [Bacteriovoracaceae bacterium]|jgi:hypothetical protein
MIFFLFISLNLAQSLACDVEWGVKELIGARTEIEKEDALDSISASLTFCHPNEYPKVALDVLENTDLGDYFIQSLLYQYGQLVGNSYQIGNNWNRVELLEMRIASLDRYLLRVGTATGIYLGKYNGKSLIATNRHVLESESCDEIVIMNYKGFSLACSKFILPNSRLDFAFILLDTVIEETPVMLEWNQRESKTRLLTAGRGHHLNEGQAFFEESSELCQIFLPDNNGESMGCDSSPGDSGSPVFIKDERKLYGLANSTGNYILNFTNNNYVEILSHQNLHGLIKFQSSHMVPLYRIKKELKNSNLTKESREIITCMLEHGCLQ